MGNMLDVNNVTKKFGEYKASNNISFSVEKGRIFGLLGPNGAGKTTMIRMINNIYTPDEGQILVFGEKLEQKHLNKMAYLPEERGLYKKMKVIDQLIYFGKLKGLTRQEASTSVRKWLLFFEANDWSGKKIQELSKGMQQKIQFIATILHNPEFIVLDEPFSGFDPINAELLKSLILKLKQEGKTIILSTHQMEQVEQLCDEIALINKGELILSGKVTEVKKQFKSNKYLLDYDGDSNVINKISGITLTKEYNNNTIEFSINDSSKKQEVLKDLFNSVEVIKFEHHQPSLNDIFIEVVNSSNQRSIKE